LKLFHKAKDGGVESKVTGYWLIESKRFFSIALLRFDGGTRDAYHNHAFNAISWVLDGCLKEESSPSEGHTFREYYYSSIVPIITLRDRMHRVTGIANKTWVLTFRGPWDDTWKEQFPNGKEITLTHGRKEV
jgi:hypothetical protein